MGGNGRVIALPECVDFVELYCDAALLCFAPEDLKTWTFVGRLGVVGYAEDKRNEEIKGEKNYMKVHPC